MLPGEACRAERVHQRAKVFPEDGGRQFGETPLVEAQEGLEIGLVVLDCVLTLVLGLEIDQELVHKLDEGRSALHDLAKSGDFSH